MSKDGTAATLRTVRSTAPKGDYFQEETIGRMSREDREEMHRANALIDDLDRYFKPTIKSGQLPVAQDEKESESEVEEDQVRKELDRLLDKGHAILAKRSRRCSRP